jgi:DNA-binding NarL/FixJ family response regulator
MEIEEKPSDHMPTLSNDRRRLRIGLMDFEPLRVTGFESVFEDVPQIEVAATDLAGVLADDDFEMVLLGLHVPVESFELLARLKSARPKLKLIVMGSESDDETIISAIGAGAKGYLEETATLEQVMQCIEVVESGSIWAPRRVLSAFVDRMLHASEKPVLRHDFNFTERERAVLKLLVAARSNREIADTLGIEERTVKAYVARLMRKVGVENRIALSIHAASRALVPDDDEE